MFHANIIDDIFTNDHYSQNSIQRERKIRKQIKSNEPFLLDNGYDVPSGNYRS